MVARGASPWLLLPALGLGAALALGAADRPLARDALGVLALATLGLLLAFFRDPERRIGPGVVAPADGRVVDVSASGPSSRLAIFLAPWNVHVLRAPADGTIEETTYRRGGHRPAFSKASAQNERLELRLGTAEGTMGLALIAGTVARRIHPYVGAGDRVLKGQRIALIAFGSRCELTLPAGRVPTVRVGQPVRAGATSVAEARGP